MTPADCNTIQVCDAGRSSECVSALMLECPSRPSTDEEGLA